GRSDLLYDALHGLTPEKEKALKAEWKEKYGLTRSPISYLLKEGCGEVTPENGGEGLSAETSMKLSEQLARIVCDVPLGGTTLSDLEVRIDRAEAEKVLTELEIGSLSADFLETEEKPVMEENVTVIDDFDDLMRFEALCMGDTALGVYYKDDEGLYVARGDRTVTLLKEQFFITKNGFGDFIRRLGKAGIPVYTLDGKLFYKEFGLVLRDVSIAAYLMNPLANAYTLSYLAVTYTDLSLAPKEHAEEDPFRLALIPLVSGVRLMKELEEAGMFRLYTDVELKTMACLAELETTGILVKKEALSAFSETLLRETEALEKEIYALSGEAFNINSPKQLAQILFEKMAIPYPKKNAKGQYSTSADILEKLASEHPVVEKVLEYRTYAKLRSTYAEGLRSFIHEDGRIYGTFYQTVTATGRLSSANPNLQNIPVRIALGREIRKLFVPKEGCVFIDADYSQIELRVMAHMSGDENLIDAYNHAADVHALTASQVFHVPLEEVTREMRSNAKAVNFGIIYGISAFGLADNLSISRTEAEQYISGYFKAFPGIERFQKESIAFARENGFVKTLYGRIRPIPELNSQSFHERMFAERVAMNSPIQGTAADIMKIAMIRVSDKLKELGLRSRIVLQVHDELLVEAYEEEADRVEEILVREMEHAADLRVRLEVEVKRGYSWYETK
ncbi:MAG: DNA polymerase I, partial [Lachnospiraceae bacterium]|nr:DNA polymerase I [Lachnospiraceae bacterium]